MWAGLWGTTGDSRARLGPGGLGIRGEKGQAGWKRCVVPWGLGCSWRWLHSSCRAGSWCWAGFWGNELHLWGGISIRLGSFPPCSSIPTGSTKGAPGAPAGGEAVPMGQGQLSARADAVRTPRAFQVELAVFYKALLDLCLTLLLPRF